MKRKRFIVKGEKCAIVKDGKWIKLSVLCLVALLNSCAGIKSQVADKSWEGYCREYGVNVNAPSDEEYDMYLDAWVGSAAEEDFLGK